MEYVDAFQEEATFTDPVILFTNAFVKDRGNANGVEVMNLKFLTIFLGRKETRG